MSDEKLAQKLAGLNLEASLRDALRAGEACRLYGPNDDNCAGRWFATAALCGAWQLGYGVIIPGLTELSTLDGPGAAKRLTNLVLPIDPAEAYRAGEACRLQGPDDRNCDFKWFTTPQAREAWQKGYGQPLDNLEEIAETARALLELTIAMATEPDPSA